MFLCILNCLCLNRSVYEALRSVTIHIMAAAVYTMAPIYQGCLSRGAICSRFVKWRYTSNAGKLSLKDRGARCWCSDLRPLSTQKPTILHSSLFPRTTLTSDGSFGETRQGWESHWSIFTWVSYNSDSQNFCLETPKKKLLSFCKPLSIWLN